MLIIYCCVVITPKFSSLKQHTCHVTISIIRSLGAARLPPLLPPCMSHPKCQPGWGFISRFRRGKDPQLWWLLAGFNSSRAFGLRASVLCRLLTRGHPPLLAMWASPLWQVVSSKHKNQEGNRGCQQGGSHNLT